MTREAALRKAHEMKAAGATYREISQELKPLYKGRKGALTPNGVAYMLNNSPNLPAVRQSAPAVSYQRIPPLPGPPPEGYAMVIIARPDQLAQIAKGMLP